MLLLERELAVKYCRGRGKYLISVEQRFGINAEVIRDQGVTGVSNFGVIVPHLFISGVQKNFTNARLAAASR
jgi:hypothetical protein